MIKIDLLKNHPNAIPALAHIWCEVLGKTWVPDVTVAQVMAKFAEHVNEQVLPITWVALDDGVPMGMCSLRQNDGIRPELTPWLGSLVVAPEYQKQGIGQLLVDAVVLKAKTMRFETLHLFTFDPTLPDYYKRLGWRTIGTDTFKSHFVTVMEIDLQS